MSEVSEFIDQVSSVSADESFKIKIPTRGKDATCNATPLNLRQQKDIIGTAVDGMKGVLNFTKILNDIISNNTDIKEPRLYHRVSIICALRSQALGESVTIENIVFSLDKVADLVSKVPLPPEDTKTFESGGFRVELEIPALSYENTTITRCVVEIDKVKDIDKSVGMIYLFELSKYIKSIEVVETDSKISFKDIKILDRIKIIEKLPLSVYNETADFLKTVMDYENDILTFGDDKLVIDASFFDIASKD